MNYHVQHSSIAFTEFSISMKQNIYIGERRDTYNHFHRLFTIYCIHKDIKFIKTKEKREKKINALVQTHPNTD